MNMHVLTLHDQCC